MFHASGLASHNVQQSGSASSGGLPCAGPFPRCGYCRLSNEPRPLKQNMIMDLKHLKSNLLTCFLQPIHFLFSNGESSLITLILRFSQKSGRSGNLGPAFSRGNPRLAPHSDCPSWPDGACAHPVSSFPPVLVTSHLGPLISPGWPTPIARSFRLLWRRVLSAVVAQRSQAGQW